MQSTLAQVCALQPHYSSKNTLEMQERGRLIRTVLTEELRARIPQLRTAFPAEIQDLAVDASDGIGRKTEAPWVRLHSRILSPNPRKGFYLVVHFAADGSAVFITVGCGSTVLRGGALEPLPDAHLDRRTSWARSVIKERWGSLAPFNDQIKLGAVAPLPRTFEKSTSFAKRISSGELVQVDLDKLLLQASERLGEIYAAQMLGRDTELGEQAIGDVTAIARPVARRSVSQGFGLTAFERHAVEQQAMSKAQEYLSAVGFECLDVSDRESYDILATRDGLNWKVEVKGTTSDFCDSILMTKNEVTLHRTEKGKTALIVVSGIRLERRNIEPIASGGIVEPFLGWDIDAWAHNPIAFQLTRPTKFSAKQ